jgi:5-methylcytosine-specific restriction endonuclease McrA
MVKRKKKGRIPKPKQPSTSLRVDWVRTGSECDHPRSRIYRDGREKLVGKDYIARVREVLERDGGKCQWPCTFVNRAPGKSNYANDAIAEVPCNQPADDVDHIVKRSKGRDDRASNLRSLCRAHHDLRHKEFRTQFRAARRAPGVGEGK